MEEKKGIIIGVAIAIVAILFINSVIGNKENNSINAKVIANNKEFQEVKLSFKNYEYVLEPSNLKKDVPVKMIVDLDSVYGCMRDIVIPQFNVKKYVKEKDNIIEFIPNKAGTFNIACSMNMGRGTFIVYENDGTKSEFAEPEIQTASGSCSSSGGCGCGGY